MGVRRTSSVGDRYVSNGPSSAGDSLGRDRVIEIQRARILAATAEVSAERGAGSVTVAHVVEHAGVSRRTFYELFVDREECFLAAFDEAIARALRCALDGYDPDAKWDSRIRAALVGVLSFLETEHVMALLLFAGTLEAGPRVLERRRRALAQMVCVVDEGRREAKGDVELSSLTAEGVVGGVVSVLHSRLLEDCHEEILELTGPLMGIIVLPYLGPAAARREIRSPAPQRVGARRVGGDPLRELGIRLTYRTMRVLVSVGADPGSSNREIGVSAGIGDQGQISKLLGRLERLGLVENKGLAPGRGAPNAWMLTVTGARVEQTMGANAGSPARAPSFELAREGAR